MSEKAPAPFAYQLGTITDGNNQPVSDRAFVEIVEAHDPQVLLGEINIEGADATRHALLIVAAIDTFEALKAATRYLRRDTPAVVRGAVNAAIKKASVTSC